MRILFMGTPEFAVPCFERLLSDGHEIVLTVTQADKPKGRGYVMTPSPVKAAALSHGIPVYQPKTFKNNDEALKMLSDCRPDVAVVVAYGKILPQSVLDIPKHGCVNVHASLLPKYRGSAPYQWAVLNGEKETGVTTMLLDAGIDTGDMLMKRHVTIPEDMTAGELIDRLMAEGAEALSDTLKAMEAGELTPVKQDESLSSYAPMLSKKLSPIDWGHTAEEIHNQIRGLNPWPSAATAFGGKLLKIHRSKTAGKSEACPGTIVKLRPFTVSCGGNTSLEIQEVQLEGSKRMAAAEFLRGHGLKVGQILSDL
ncbi:MAG TPA: methionyl-tRNA formyltransferase [Clostridia bacterium]|nr:methionyl-tRNA formyltransferase [Clostridia bacterium]